jgi:ubiquinone/menaquinone biosynthesis C-methylase UbiE
MEEKEFCLKEYGFFEWPNMVALNWVVASMVGSDKRILEVGAGTGCFAFYASTDPARSLLCLEADRGAREWAIQHRLRPNIEYADKRMEELPDRSFDLLVSVDVVEHIEDYKGFLQQCARVAKRAIITTPNRFRNGERLITPVYKQHVQEWNAGEFYYILKNFWDEVNLFTTPNPYIPIYIPCDINTELHPLIAVCSHKGQ